MDPNASAHDLFNQASPSSNFMESTGSAKPFDPEDQHRSNVHETERDVQQKIAIWAHESEIPARAFESESFKKLLKVLGELGPGFHFEPPTEEELRTTILSKAVDKTKKRLKKHEDEWRKSGCSIIIDMWPIKKKTTIMNLCVNSRLGTVFLSTKDVPHTAQHIYKYVESCIQEVGHENVVQIVTNDFLKKTESQNLLNEKNPTIFWTTCVTQTINLMLEGITDLPMFKKVLDQAKALTVFIYSHHETLTLMRNFTKKRDIVRQGVTKSASTYLTLQILLKKKTEIQNMFSSMELEEFEFSKVHWKFVYEIVQDTGFWENVALCLKVFSPLIEVLRMVDIDKKPSMGFVYAEIMNARNAIIDVLVYCEKDYEPIMDIILSNMKGKLDSCLHLTAYLLNPYYHYKDPNIQHDVEVMDAVLEFFDTIFHGDLEMQHQIINVELPKYKNKEGAFGRELAAKACEVNDDTFDPGNWWGTFGGSTSCLRKIAMRILSLTTSSSGCDRNRYTLKRAHMKKVNELTTTQMNDYIFVQFNSNLKSKYKKNKEKNMEVLLASDAKEAQEWLVDDDDDEVELEMLWEADEVDYESDGVHIMEEYGDVDMI